MVVYLYLQSHSKGRHLLNRKSKEPTTFLSLPHELLQKIIIQSTPIKAQINDAAIRTAKPAYAVQSDIYVWDMLLRKVHEGLVYDVDLVKKKWHEDLNKVYAVFGDKGLISVHRKHRVVSNEDGLERTFEQMSDEVGAETFLQWF